MSVAQKVPESDAGKALIPGQARDVLGGAVQVVGDFLSREEFGHTVTPCLDY